MLPAAKKNKQFVTWLPSKQEECFFAHFTMLHNVWNRSVKINLRHLLLFLPENKKSRHCRLYKSNDLYFSAYMRYVCYAAHLLLASVYYDWLSQLQLLLKPCNDYLHLLCIIHVNKTCLLFALRILLIWIPWLEMFHLPQPMWGRESTTHTSFYIRIIWHAHS